MQKYLNKLGWRKISTRFCQFVSNKNRIERVIYCNLCKTHKELFKFSIFLDECIVAMDKNGKFQWYKKGLKGETRSGLQAKYKHAASVNILGGISRRGATKLMIFTGHLNAPGFRYLEDLFIVPFVTEVYPDYHRLHLDNASYHVTDTTVEWLERNDLNHFKSPAQSPDLNPIELVWNDMKSYIGRIVKPKTLQELSQGIIQFWNEQVTKNYCNSKIDHLYRVIDTVIELKGKATGL